MRSMEAYSGRIMNGRNPYTRPSTTALGVKRISTSPSPRKSVMRLMIPSLPRITRQA